MSALLYAHSLSGSPEIEWELLGDHLCKVAGLAGKFCGKFGADDWGHVAGLLHDIGKQSGEFQNRLRGGTATVDHATAGARIATESLGLLGHLLAYVIAGHHAGLANGTGDGPPTPLASRLNAAAYRIPSIPGWQEHAALPPTLSTFAPTHRADLTGPLDRRGFSCAFRTRMVFSALIDADRLATEDFYQSAGAETAKPRGQWQPLADLTSEFNRYMAAKAAHAAAGVLNKGQRQINAHRAQILDAARTAAKGDRGLYSLTVPTGGGKTLASLSFALDHAVTHGLDRIIYVIPFTSIIEQTAAVFRTALGPQLSSHILEHHSAFREDEALAKMEAAAGGGESGLQAGERLRFATENWDAPIIVTTAVQFFESLFSNRPCRCRKLHNIARSVVIMDEAQTLPLTLLRPTLAAIEELTLHYHTTAVLCTATQPAVQAHKPDGQAGLKGGLSKVREIISDPRHLYEAMARVTVKPCRNLTDDALVEALAAAGQVLCIVGTRAHARDLTTKLATRTSPESTFHLSALMCPAHRTRKLTDIRAALNAGGPVRVVATTVIEAGVDISFPLVWRQMAGLDSIAQAAGRCNREGQLPKTAAIVQLFEVDGRTSIRELRANEAAAREILRRDLNDPLGLDAIEAYFDHLYWSQSEGSIDRLDAEGILAACNAQVRKGLLPFADVARAYQIIKTTMEPVIIPWDDGARAAIDELGASSLPPEAIRAVARRLQPYIVNIPKDAFAQLRSLGRIEAINPHRFEEQFMRLSDEAYPNLYDNSLGFDWNDPAFRKIENNQF